MPKLKDPNYCDYVYSRGNNKGSRCNKKCIQHKCKRHNELGLQTLKKYYQERKDKWRELYPNLYVNKCQIEKK